MKTAINMKNAHLILEFVSGLENYYDGSFFPKTENDLLFFICHENKMAYDDANYNEFLACFPNFFQYIDHLEAFLEWFSTQELTK
jgi:hypothetical protein